MQHLRFLLWKPRVRAPRDEEILGVRKACLERLKAGEVVKHWPRRFVIVLRSVEHLLERP
jgi:hypothetical protein